MHLSQQEKQTINQRIKDVELTTNAELVTVIAQRSDHYYYIPTLWAALLSLSFPGILAILGKTIESANWSASIDSVDPAYLIQVAIFIVAAVVFQWTPLKMLLVPKYVKYSRASRHAHELFFIEGLHLTNDNTGLMLFVSKDEKYAEIIADAGINQNVQEGEWQNIIDNFVNLVDDGKVAEAYLSTIDECGALLSEHYPAKGKNDNELPDHLIEI